MEMAVDELTTEQADEWWLENAMLEDVADTLRHWSAMLVGGPCSPEELAELQRVLEDIANFLG